MQMKADRYMKRCSMTLSGKCKTKSHIKHNGENLMHIRMTIKTTTAQKTSVGTDVEKLKLF